MALHYKTIVPNLDRRPDRWYTCLGALLALEYKPDFIQRFSAHDGNDYESSDAARAAAAKHFSNSRYLCTNRLGTHYFCWSWTWYEILSQIADGVHGDLVLVLIDDIRPRHIFGQMLKFINELNSVCPVKCIQLSPNNQRPGGFTEDDVLPPGEPIPGIPFRRGIHTSGDFANIVSPEGAREILAVADSYENLGVPNLVFWWVARDLSNLDGYYCGAKISHRYTICDRYTYDVLGNPHVSGFQDGRNEDPTTKG